jgi:hypothetical protein
MARGHRTDEVDAVRITSAAASRNEDIAARQKRYLLSMSLRSACFVGAIVASMAGIGWLWPILIAGALILPYFAVVLANVSATRSDGFALVDPGLGLRELGGPGSAKPLGRSSRDQ